MLATNVLGNSCILSPPFRRGRVLPLRSSEALGVSNRAAFGGNHALIFSVVVSGKLMNIFTALM